MKLSKVIQNLNCFPAKFLGLGDSCKNQGILIGKTGILRTDPFLLQRKFNYLSLGFRLL